MPSAMAERQYDVVLYGAAGFTGRQTVDYFVRHAPPAVRWAIAGRHHDKLTAVARNVGAAVDILIADSRTQTTVDAVAERTRVLLTTAGPFALYGTAVVDACVRNRTHYVDITGETAWVRELIARYHDRAAADGTRIVPFCGFDSIPSDIGALLVTERMKAVGTSCAELRAYFQMRGGINGGTIASALNTIESGQRIEPSSVVRVHRDPTIGAWIGPFVMAPINSWVVHRSTELREEVFSYVETAKFSPPFAAVKAWTVTAGLGLFNALLRNPVTRSAIRPLLPKPGTGPSRETMDRGWFTCELFGTSVDGRRFHAVIRNQGDPGNRSTVKFVCESALTLALDTNRLPGGLAKGGILTPATALGDPLVDRLRRAGVEIALD